MKSEICSQVPYHTCAYTIYITLIVLEKLFYCCCFAFCAWTDTKRAFLCSAVIFAAAELLPPAGPSFELHVRR